MSVYSIENYGVAPSGLFEIKESYAKAMEDLGMNYYVTIWYYAYSDKVLLVGSNNPIDVIVGGSSGGDDLFVASSGGYKYIFSDIGTIQTYSNSGNYMLAQNLKNKDAWVRNTIWGDLPPKTNLSDSNLGKLLNWNVVNYKLNSVTGRNINIVEKLNGVVIKTLNNKMPNSANSVSLDWDTVPFGNNVLEIITSSVLSGSSNKVELSFTKTKKPIQKISTDTTLVNRSSWEKELVKELAYQNNMLSSNLINKGVVLTEAEKIKMSILIAKVANIELGRKWASGYVTPSSGTSKYPILSGTSWALSTGTANRIVVNNLSFKPSLVVAFAYDSSKTYLALKCYCTSYVNEISDFKYGEYGNFRVALNYSGNLGVTGHIFSENGFELVASLSTFEINAGIFWIAYE